MNLKSMNDDSKKLRVWWNSGGSAVIYYIDKIEDAQIIIDVLSIREVNDDSIDFNAYGVEILEDGEWSEWCNDEGFDYDEYIESLEGN